MKTTILALLLLVASLLTSQAANGPEITLSGPFPTDNTNEVYFVAATTQLSNNVLKIEQSVNNLFNFSVSATWSCYPFEQQVAGFFIVPANSDDRFYRAVNTPCGAGNFAPAAIQEQPFRPTLTQKQYRWHTKEGYRINMELPQTDPKVRRFILLKTPTTTNVLPPFPGKMPPNLPEGAMYRRARPTKSLNKLRSPKDS